MIHIGKEIRDTVKRKKISISQLAEMINKSRPLVYDIFERESIDTGLLQKLSEVLEFNFFSYYQTGHSAEEPREEYRTFNNGMEEMKKKLSEKEHELDIAKSEIQYLRRINTLLEEKLKRMEE